jgi:hypothetical protein
MMGKSIQNLVLLAGSFMLTFALLLTVWMVATGAPQATPQPSPTPAPPATLAPLPSQTPLTPGLPTPSAPAAPTDDPTTLPSPTVSAPPSATPFPLPSASWSPPPMRTPPPSIAPAPSVEPGEIQTLVIAGTAYVAADVPSNGQLLNTSRGALLETSRDSSDALWVTYDLPPERLPAGALIHSVDVRVCGIGEGDFWEVYGPPGGEPFEYEVVAPGADGCWHFFDAPAGDLSVIAATMLQSRLLIERIEYTITFGV